MIKKTIPNKKLIIVDDNLSLFFISSENSFHNENDSVLHINQNLKCNIENNSNNLDFIFINSSISSSSFLLKIDFDMLLEVNSNYITFFKNSFTYVLVGENCQFDLDKEEILTVRVPNQNSKITLYYYDNYFLSTRAYISGTTTIDENSYMPEFSISVFDDSLFTRPRPIRQGVPIVSTVPSFINSTSSSTDENYFESGKGPEKRTLYFRIICNKVMENISENAESSMKLKVYMPNGLDTVKTAIYRPMYLSQNDNTNGISIYYASHDFYVQGNFNGIEYVDGYMYCDVQVPLTVRRTLPIEFDFILYD